MIKSFVNMVKTQFSTVVKIFRADNALELGSNREAIEFFHDQGILHQTSVFVTPQQNGVVERNIDIFWKFVELCFSNLIFLFTFGVIVC